MASYEELEKAIRKEHERLKDFDSIQKIISSQYGIAVEYVDKGKVESIQEKIKKENTDQHVIEKIKQHARNLVKYGASRDYVIEQIQIMINFYNLLSKSQLIVDITLWANSPE